MRKNVATVAELWRYPVKSMRGERLDEMVLTERGPVGDRLYAMRELKYGFDHERANLGRDAPVARRMRTRAG